MSGFNKRSRLTPPSPGKSGAPSKGTPDKTAQSSGQQSAPEKTAQQSSGQQKAPSKKLQWSMNDLLTKLDSGDAPPESVAEAMAQARAGEAVQPPPPPVPTAVDQSVRTTEEPAFVEPSHAYEQSENPKNGDFAQRTAEDHISYEECANASVAQAIPEQNAAEQSFSSLTGGGSTFCPPTEQQRAAEQSFSAFTSSRESPTLPGDPATESFRQRLDHEYNAQASPAAAAAQAQFDAYTSQSNISFVMPDAEPAPAQVPMSDNGSDIVAYQEMSGYDAPSEMPAYDVQSEVPGTPAYDPQFETPAYDPQSEVPGYDGQSETPGYDAQFETPAYDPQFETPAYDAQFETSAYDAQSETTAYDAQSESAAYDAQSETPAYDAQSESTAYDAQSESTAYDAQSESTAYDAQPETTYDAQSATAYDAQSETAYDAQSATAYDAQSETAYDAQSATAYDAQSETAYDAQSESTAYNAQSETAYDAQSESTAYNAQSETAYDAQSATAYDAQSESTAYDSQSESTAYDAESETTVYQSGTYEEIGVAADYTEGSGQPNYEEHIADGAPAGMTYEEGFSSPEFQPQTEGVFDESGGFAPTEPSDNGEINWDEPVPTQLDAEWMEPGVTADTPPLEWSEPEPAPAAAPESQTFDAAPQEATPRTSTFGAAANLLKKAAQKKTEILRDEPHQEPAFKEGEDEDAEEPYTFQRPELPVVEKPHTAPTTSGSIEKESLQFETGRIILTSEMRSAEPFASLAPQTAPPQVTDQPVAANTEAATPVASLPGLTTVEAFAASTVPEAPPLAAAQDTGMIDMREMISKIAPNFANSPPPTPNAVPVSPPNQFKREQIPHSEPTKVKPAEPTKDATGDDAADTPKPEGTAAATKPKKKKTGAKSKPADPAPQADVVKQIQKMAPLSSMRAAEQQESANEEAKLERKDLVNQTNLMKNRMRSVPAAGEDSKLARQAKIRAADTLGFLGRHQRHVAAAAALGMLAIAATLFASFHANGDLDQKIADKMDKKQFDDARDLVDKGLTQFPNDPKLHYFKGRLLAKQGQKEQALQEYMVATIAQPDNLSFVNDRAKLYIELHKFSEAIADYNRLLTSHDYAKPYNFANRAVANFERGHLNEALTDANKAIKMEPNKPDYYATRAWAYAGLKQYDRAIEDWSTVIAKDPTDAIAYAERARTEKSNNDVKAAIDDLAKSISIKPSGSAYYYRGLIYRDQKQPAQAIEQFTEALKYDSRNPSYLEARAQVYAASGNFEQAVQSYDALAALQNTGGSPDFYAARAQAEMKAGKYGAAVDDWQKILASKPDDKSAKINHAESCLNDGEYTKAYDDYSVLIEKDPKNVMWYVKRAVVSSKQKHYSVGAADFEKAIGIDPNNPNSYLYRGLVSADQGLLDQARVDFEHVLRLQPDNALAKEKYHELAKLRIHSPSSPTIASLPPPRRTSAPATASSGDPLTDGYNQWRLGNLPAAVNLFAAAAKKSPNNALTRRYLAYVLLQNGQAAEAISQFKALATLGSLTADDEEKYTDALIKSGDQQGGAALLNKLIANQPDDTPARVKLARLYSDMGQNDKARQIVVDGLKVAKSPEDSTALRDLYNALQSK